MFTIDNGQLVPSFNVRACAIHFMVCVWIVLFVNAFFMYRLKYS